MELTLGLMLRLGLGFERLGLGFLRLGLGLGLGLRVLLLGACVGGRSHVPGTVGTLHYCAEVLWSGVGLRGRVKFRVKGKLKVSLGSRLR